MTRMAHAVRAEDGTKDGLIPGDQDRREVRIQTYYEKIWLEKEKKICYLKFKL